MRQELRTLAKDTADLVARHLVAAGRLFDDDPQLALAHARAAGALAGRLAVVREAVGLAAYAAGEWTEALAELRTARRISGRADHLAVMADCERALGRPERALALLDDPDVSKLAQATRVELVIVVAGARRDLDQADAAVLLLQGPARATTVRRPWASRLWYAYADALLNAGREDESREWFAKAAEHDGQGETDAMDRLLQLDGLVIDDLLSDAAEESGLLEQEADEPLDLQALLTAPVPAEADSAGSAPPEVEGADAPSEARAEHEAGSGRADDAVREAADDSAPGGAGAPADDSALAGVEDVSTASGASASGASGSGASGSGAPESSAPEAKPAPVAMSGPLFSDEVPVAESAPVRPAVPVVTFATPPAEEEDEPEDRA